jgi:hypothetical protein
MRLDEVVLALQRATDRFILRLLGKPGRPERRRRFLIVQIDGLSRAVLERALAAGHMPFTARLLARGKFRLTPMSVGLPTSTPSFQMALMYGIKPDIPGFHYHHRGWKADVHFPRAGHAARVEAEQAGDRRGILEGGGSTYGCAFTGGAANNLFSFARLTRPTADGIVRAAASGFVLLWVVLKCLTISAHDLLRAVARFLQSPRRRRRPDWRWLLLKLGISVWVRQFFTLAVARDLYRGTPAVYVNFLDYDVMGHAYGPTHRIAFRALRHVDRSIRQLARVLRRVADHEYDLFILSDHGQAVCRPFTEISGGQRIERMILDELLADRRPRRRPSGAPRRGVRRWLQGVGASEKGLFQRFLNYLEADFPYRVKEEKEAAEAGGVRVIAAGPNAFIYLVDRSEPADMDEIERQLPGLADALSRAPGIGYVLARSADGPLCWWRGKRHRLELGEAGPFAGRADLDLVLDGIRDLMSMPSAGDLVIYGLDAPKGHVSYIAEIGAHAGTSPEEMHTFIVHGAGAPLPERIVHAVELYPFFMRYREVA